MGDDGAVAARIEAVNGRLKRIDTRLDNHDDRVRAAERGCASTSSAINQRLVSMERRTGENETAITLNKTNISDFKSALRLNTFKTGAVFTVVQIVVGLLLAGLIRASFGGG